MCQPFCRRKASGKTAWCVLGLILPMIFAVAPGCTHRPDNTIGDKIKLLTDDQIERVTHQKIFFGHKSVGFNIVQGISDLVAADPRLKLNLVHSSQPATIAAPAFIESPVGENTDPVSKDKAFADMLAFGMGEGGGIAMYKYCWADIHASTDVQELFERYRSNINSLRKRYPNIKFVHITAPLTTVEPAGRAWLKSLLGRETDRNADRKRNEYNRLLKAYYQGEPIFDLAEVESTLPDGSRTFFISEGWPVYVLASEYTDDGGHLNEAGRWRAAHQLLVTLAEL